MQQKDRPVLTAAALFCRILGWFPVWLLVLSVSGQMRLQPVGVLLGCAWISVLICRCVRIFRRTRPRFTSVVSAAVMLGFAALCGWALFRLTGSLTVTVLLTGITVLPSHARLGAEPDELFRVQAYAAFLTANVIACTLLWAAHLPIPMDLVLAAVGLLTAVYFILRNQFMLLRLVNRRSNTAAEIPQEIRRGNLMLIGGVIVLFVLVFVFRAPLLELLFRIQDAVNRLLGALAEWLIRLVSWLGGDAPEPEEIAEFEQEMPAADEKGSPLWMLLWIPVLAVVWYMWRVLLADWVFELRVLVSRLLRRLRRREDAETAGGSAENAEYVDTEIRLRPAESRRKRRRSWKRALKSWQQMPDNDGKFYAGYRLLLTAPAWEAGEVRAADTVCRIEEKWMQGHTPQKLLEAVTADFQADRYAECGLPPEALSDMTAALLGIAKSG